MAIAECVSIDKHRKLFTHLTLGELKAQTSTTMGAKKAIQFIHDRPGPKVGRSYGPRGKSKTLKFRADLELAKLIEDEADAYRQSVSAYLTDAIRTLIRERYPVKKYRDSQ